MLAKPRPAFDYIVKPKAPYSIQRKHVGYFCLKCQNEKRLNMTKLCDCLILVEDSKEIKTHINTQWVPMYAEVAVSPYY